MAALILFGLIIALVSGSHGLSDLALVAQLRANGVVARGFLNDQHNVSTGSNGDQSVTDTGVLVFKDRDGVPFTVTDPAIGGHPLPLNAADPQRTHTPVTVVYLPDQPGTAAPSQEMRGSVWNGAPTANVVSGIVLILGVPALLVWRLMSRRRRRWKAGADLLDHIAGS